MRLLVLTLNFEPDSLGNATLVSDLCAGLAGRGHRVRVVTAFPHHDSGRVAPGYGGLFPRSARSPGGTEVVRTYVATPAGSSTVWNKAATWASFTVSAVPPALAGWRPDVILALSPPISLGVVGGLVGSLRRAPLVWVVQDIFPAAAVEAGVVGRGALLTGLRVLERLAYRAAARIVAISEGFRDTLTGLGAPWERIAVIPNFVDTRRIVPASPATEFRKGLGLEGRFVVLYAGRIGLAQGLDVVLSAAERLSGRDDVVFLLAGDGCERERLAALAARRRLGNVRFHPPVPRERYPELLATADLALVPLRPGMASCSLPSKLYAHMASGRPVLAAVEEGSDAASLVREAGCGRIVPPGDAGQMAEGVLAMARDPAAREAMARAGRSHVVANNSLELALDRYESLLQDVRMGPRFP